MYPNASNAENQECRCCSSLDCKKLSKIEYPKKKLLTRAIENFYDNCAAYNLRYIPYRTLTDRKTCAKNIVKDFVVLFCFLVTNFVVFLTILSRIVMHLSGVCLGAVDWLKHVTSEKSSPKAVFCLLYKERGRCKTHDYSNSFRSQPSQRSTDL